MMMTDKVTTKYQNDATYNAVYLRYDSTHSRFNKDIHDMILSYCGYLRICPMCKVNYQTHTRGAALKLCKLCNRTGGANVSDSLFINKLLKFGFTQNDNKYEFTLNKGLKRLNICTMCSYDVNFSYSLCHGRYSKKNIKKDYKPQYFELKCKACGYDEIMCLSCVKILEYITKYVKSYLLRMCNKQDVATFRFIHNVQCIKSIFEKKLSYRDVFYARQTMSYRDETMNNHICKHVNMIIHEIRNINEYVDDDIIQYHII